MRLIFALMALVVLGGAASTPPSQPFMLCEGSSDYCALVLYNTVSSDFIVDDQTTFDRIKAMKPESFKMGVRRVDFAEKQRLELQAKQQKAQARIDGQELEQLRRQGESAITSSKLCAVESAICGTSLVATVLGYERGKMQVFVSALIVATLSCVQSGMDCIEMYKSVDYFREDYKTWEAKQFLKENPVGGGGGSEPPGTIHDLGGGEDLHPTTDHRPNCSLLPATTISTSEGDSWDRPSEMHCL